MNTRTVCATVTVTLLLFIPAHAQWLNYPTPGVPRLPDGKPNLKAPVPRMADGKPNLSGVWDARCYSEECLQSGAPLAGGASPLFMDLAQSLKASDVELTPWAVGIQAQRVKRDHVDDPYGYCLLPGVPRINFIGTLKIIPTAQVTVFLYETAANLAFRQVFTDGRPLPEISEHTWLGYSIGKWEGDRDQRTGFFLAFEGDRARSDNCGSAADARAGHRHGLCIRRHPVAGQRDRLRRRPRYRLHGFCRPCSASRLSAWNGREAGARHSLLLGLLRLTRPDSRQDRSRCARGQHMHAQHPPHRRRRRRLLGIR